MDVILERLAEYVESSEELRREVKSAMTYPVISLVLVLGITAFLMLGVVPTFRQVFESLGSKLPPLTEFVLGASDYMREKWSQGLGIILVAAAVAFARAIGRSVGAGDVRDRSQLRLLRAIGCAEASGAIWDEPARAGAGPEARSA